MNCLEERILKDGIVKEGNVLKVDSFLNHQMDIDLFTVVHKQLFQRTVFQSVQALRTLVRDLDHRLVQLMQHLKRVRDTLNLQKVT